MLRIVLEFHHVVFPVVAPHQVRLRPSTHSPNLFEGYRHARMLVPQMRGSKGCGTGLRTGITESGNIRGRNLRVTAPPASTTLPGEESWRSQFFRRIFQRRRFRAFLATLRRGLREGFREVFFLRFGRALRFGLAFRRGLGFGFAAWCEGSEGSAGSASEAGSSSSTGSSSSSASALTNSSLSSPLSSSSNGNSLSCSRVSDIAASVNEGYWK